MSAPRVQLLLGALVLAASCGRWSSPAGLGGDAAGAHAMGDGGGGSDAGGADVSPGGELDAAGAPGVGGGRGGSGGSRGARGGKGAGGSSGSAGRADPAGGQAGAGETAGAAASEQGGEGASGGAGGKLPAGPCTFTVDASTSPAIGTVGIVKWSVNMDVLETASIEFGLDESYGLTAPVDLGEPDRRTLLLGMKAARDYHYRILAHGGGEDCASADAILTTGPLSNGLPKLTVMVDRPSLRAGGYLVLGFMSRGPAVILDADGDYVWWAGAVEAARAEMSHDGKYMWYGNINVKGGAPAMHRVGMDGLGDESHPEFGDRHHDFTVLPDETVGFIQHDGPQDRIMERAPDGTVTKIIEVSDAHGGITTNHTNSIHYHADDDSYTFSDLNQNAYVKVKRSGEVVWILGGTTSQFTGDGAIWKREHGHHLIAPDRLLFFNNGTIGGPAAAVEVSLDFTTMTATRVWEYDGAFATAIYGDVQRLPNGNTLVTFSTAGVIAEVDPSGSPVMTIGAALGGAMGYVIRRSSLYGPPD